MGLRLGEKPLVMGGGIWRVPKVRGPLLSVLIIRIRIYWGLITLGSPYFGKLPYGEV